MTWKPTDRASASGHVGPCGWTGIDSVTGKHRTRQMGAHVAREVMRSAAAPLPSSAGDPAQIAG
jgi:hypothetical protein